MTSLKGHKVPPHQRIHHRRKYQGKQDRYSMHNLLQGPYIQSRDGKCHHEGPTLCNRLLRGKDSGIPPDRQHWRSGQFHPPVGSPCPRIQSQCRSSLKAKVSGGQVLPSDSPGHRHKMLQRRCTLAEGSSWCGQLF